MKEQAYYFPEAPENEKFLLLLLPQIPKSSIIFERKTWLNKKSCVWASYTHYFPSYQNFYPNATEISLSRRFFQELHKMKMRVFFCSGKLDGKI